MDPIYLFFGSVISAVIGGMIGSVRNQITSGVVWGLLLGPLGWLITFLLPDQRYKCPECHGPIEEGVRRCRHCGVDLIAVKEKELSRVNLEKAKVNHELTELKYYILDENNVEHGPFCQIELFDKMRHGKLNPKTLCAAKGDSKWITLEELRG
jgi:hypothetical protein